MIIKVEHDRSSFGFDEIAKACDKVILDIGAMRLSDSCIARAPYDQRVKYKTELARSVAQNKNIIMTGASIKKLEEGLRQITNRNVRQLEERIISHLRERPLEFSGQGSIYLEEFKQRNWKYHVAFDMHPDDYDTFAKTAVFQMKYSPKKAVFLANKVALMLALHDFKQNLKTEHPEIYSILYSGKYYKLDGLITLRPDQSCGSKTAGLVPEYDIQFPGREKQTFSPSQDTASHSSEAQLSL